MVRLFVSTVSHNNDQMIVENNVLPSLSSNYEVVVKCNTKCTDLLRSLEKENNIHIIDDEYSRGFGDNNNIAFEYCKSNLGMQPDDYFLTLNPDVIIDIHIIHQLLDRVVNRNIGIATINLFKDLELKNTEGSIRRFPGVFTPAITFLLGRNPDEYHKESIDCEVFVDWAAGSFLLFKASVYEELGGFDEKYFMYFEDVDICRRARKYGYKIIYYPDLKATHFGAYRNRNILSKNFVWYLRSYIAYHTGW
ncbi:dTDP-Rha--alpha-D-GlcNAc-pyrophosphate polyprenol alpha-3-L-rhamnosyltransferase [Citrobacter werkmanii]|uniref:Glycosyl transferase n=1 Tax=Citrobacter youngae TaxID=133448 RepID=A0A2Z4BVV7_9ENTR|nr:MULTISPECIES: glycosyltransferase family 2 protein [Citrobacter]ATF49055.1 dTDP-Rha--alpha-D-GlcNAc-pyrophosphate polyprenol alpha-3-L-rhamnosyltransferase [Citrobacter werkmanii]AWU66725.1 glycosyl transferase [Citrobacter youngae]TKU64848.1 glycosyltransferase family 2 protein [Citrobacter sp. wls711]